jgi:hypothetical protein
MVEGTGRGGGAKVTAFTKELNAQIFRNMPNFTAFSWVRVDAAYILRGRDLCLGLSRALIAASILAPDR